MRVGIASGFLSSLRSLSVANVPGALPCPPLRRVPSGWQRTRFVPVRSTECRTYMCVLRKKAGRPCSWRLPPCLDNWLVVAVASLTTKTLRGTIFQVVNATTPASIALLVRMNFSRHVALRVTPVSWRKFPFRTTRRPRSFREEMPYRARWTQLAPELQADFADRMNFFHERDLPCSVPNRQC